MIVLPSALKCTGASPTKYSHFPSPPSFVLDLFFRTAWRVVRWFEAKCQFSVRPDLRIVGEEKNSPSSSSVFRSYSSTSSDPSLKVVCTDFFVPDTNDVLFPPCLSIERDRERERKRTREKPTKHTTTTTTSKPPSPNRIPIQFNPIQSNPIQTKSGESTERCVVEEEHPPSVQP